MRWVRLWGLLASAYLAGRLLSAYLISGNLELNAPLWAHAAVVPLVQLAAVGPLLAWRRKRRPVAAGVDGLVDARSGPAERAPLDPAP